MGSGVGCCPSVPSGSFPCQMGSDTFLSSVVLVIRQARRGYRLAMAPICGVTTESVTGEK